MKNQIFYAPEWKGCSYSPPRLRKTARKMAVCVYESGDPYGGAIVKREPGCTWSGGHPVYYSRHGEYAVGRTKNIPDGAIKIKGTPLWVKKISSNGR